MKIVMKNNNNLTRPTAVIFDWYDTLLNTQSQINYKIVEKVISEIGIEYDDYKTIPYNNRYDYFLKLFTDKSKEANIIYENELERIFLHNKLNINEGVEDLLRLLTENGIYLTIVSNKKGLKLREEVEHVGLTKYFKKIIGSGDALKDKPSPLPVIKSLEGSGIALDKRVFFVGDSMTDIECAKYSGCVPIAYRLNICDDEVFVFNNFIDMRNFFIKLI